MLKYMSVSDACKAVNGTWIGSKNKLNNRICEVVIDSRKASDGVLFVAIKGERVDGHDFIPQILEAGAVAAISEKRLDDSISDYILVDNTKTALRDLAEYYRSILDIKVVGITGSVGKTSTKEMVASVLSEKFNVQKTAGNFNNEIGVPLTIFTITEEHEVAVCEMGISDFGEMTRLSKITRPDVMVITNIGQCHLEFLGDRDGVFKAKTECFDYLSEGASVVLNGADDKLIAVENVLGKRPYFFGSCNDKAFSFASDIVDKGLAGSEATLNIRGQENLNGSIVSETNSRRINIPVAGSHMVINATAAAAVGTILGMNIDEIAAGISKCEAVAGRGKLIKSSKYLLVDDTYNANPASMKAELDLLAKTSGRRVAILGDMFELGADEDKLHFEVGEYAVDKCDVFVCIGELSKNMLNGALTNATNKNIYHFVTKEDFYNSKEDILKEGDTILLKASHGMKFSEILDALSGD